MQKDEDSRFAGSTTRGYLPHRDVEGARQFITYRLADSLPQHVIEEMRQKHEPAEFRRRCQRFLDDGRGSCLLERPGYASIVQENLEHHDGRRYRLVDWVIMPTHVHVDLLQFDPLREIMHSLKSYTAKRILERLDEEGEAPATNTVWYRSYFDRRIRDERHAFAVKCYIYTNPVRAGLVDDPFDWPFSSIHDNPPEFREQIARWYRRWKERFYRSV